MLNAMVPPRSRVSVGPWIHTAGAPVGTPNRRQAVERLRGERGDVRVDRLPAEPFDHLQRRGHAAPRQKVAGAVLESLRSGLELVAIGEHGHELDGAARERRTDQRSERLMPADERADSRGVARNLVDRERDEVGPDVAQRYRIRGQEGGGIEQHRIPAPLRFVNPVERVTDAGEVRLRRIGKQAAFHAGELERADSQLIVERQGGHLCTALVAPARESR